MEEPVEEAVDPKIEEMWREVLTKGHRNRLAVLPGSHRCLTCFIPMEGLGGWMLGTFGNYRPSRKSPRLCNLCDELLPPGGAEIDLGVLFADVRGSTALGEQVGASRFASLLNRFYGVATSVVIERRGLVDKLVGDEVMAVFLPNTNANYAEVAVDAGVELLRRLGYGRGREPLLPVGVGVQAGPAYAGKIGSSGVNDFTVLGDTVNTAARLQAQAGAGELLMGEAVYRSVAGRYPDLEQRELDLKGKEGLFQARVLRLE